MLSCRTPATFSVQLITLNVESKIHVHAIAASDTGAAHGSRIRKRTRRRPTTAASRTNAPAVARITTRACEPTVNSTVLLRALWNCGSETIVAKLRSPTHENERLPAVAALKLSSTASTRGARTNKSTYAMAGASISRPSRSSRSASVRWRNTATGTTCADASLCSAIVLPQSGAGVEMTERTPRHGKVVHLAFGDRRTDRHRQVGNHRLVGSHALLQHAIHQPAGPQMLYLAHPEAEGNDPIVCSKHRLGEEVLRPEPQDGVPRPLHQIHGRRAQEGRHKCVGRVLIDLLRGSDLPHLPAIHDGNAVAQSHGLNLIVCHIDCGRPQLPLELLELESRHGAQLRVQVRERLVKQEKARGADDGPGPRPTPAPSTGEVARPAAQQG